MEKVLFTCTAMERDELLRRRESSIKIQMRGDCSSERHDSEKAKNMLWNIPTKERDMEESLPYFLQITT